MPIPEAWTALYDDLALRLGRAGKWMATRYMLAQSWQEEATRKQTSDYVRIQALQTTIRRAEDELAMLGVCSPTTPMGRGSHVTSLPVTPPERPTRQWPEPFDLPNYFGDSENPDAGH